jgi:hypothetical protein
LYTENEKIPKKPARAVNESHIEPHIAPFARRNDTLPGDFATRLRRDSGGPDDAPAIMTLPGDDGRSQGARARSPLSFDRSIDSVVTGCPTKRQSTRLPTTSMGRPTGGKSRKKYLT